MGKDEFPRPVSEVVATIADLFRQQHRMEVGYDLDFMQRGMLTAHVVEPELPASTLLAGALVVRFHPSGQQPQEVAQPV